MLNLNEPKLVLLLNLLANESLQFLYRETGTFPFEWQEIKIQLKKQLPENTRLIDRLYRKIKGNPYL